MLGWIEAVKFVAEHIELHYTDVRTQGDGPTPDGLKRALGSLPWHGQLWVQSFAHRARIFWNLAARGWETKFCGGGMIWNPRGLYKNAVTNELWISASIAMAVLVQ